MRYFKRLIQKYRLKFKIEKMQKQVRKLDVRKQQLEKECRMLSSRIDDLRKNAAKTQKQGLTSRLDDILSALKDNDLKLRNANFLLNNLDKKREKLMRAIEIARTATDDIFSGESIDFDLLENLDAQISIDAEDLQLGHKQISRLHSSLSDTRERLSSSERYDLLKQFDLETDIETEDMTDSAEYLEKREDKVDDMESVEKMERLLMRSLEETSEEMELEDCKTDPLGNETQDKNEGLKQF